MQVSTRTIASYREQRLIPYWRINSRNIRYRLSDVERVLGAAQTYDPKPRKPKLAEENGGQAL